MFQFEINKDSLLNVIFLSIRNKLNTAVRNVFQFKLLLPNVRIRSRARVALPFPLSPWYFGRISKNGSGNIRSVRVAT